MFPIGVPPTQKSLEIGKAVADISQRLNLSVKVIGSTDLTHYGMNYGFVTHGHGVRWHWTGCAMRTTAGLLMPCLLWILTRLSQRPWQTRMPVAAVRLQLQLPLQKGSGPTKRKPLHMQPVMIKVRGDSFVGYAGIVF